MKSIEKKIFKLTLSLVLAFGLIASLPYNQSSVVAKETQTTNSTVDIDTTTNYNANNTEASIIFDVDSFENKIVSVKDLNDQIIQVGKNHEYVVTENKDYNFTITYTDKNNTEKSFVKTVTIDKIGINGTNSANAWRSPLLRSNVKSGAAQITIPDYDGIGWEAYTNQVALPKKVSFTIDFGDTTSSGKKAKITIPDGMSITSLSVIGAKTDYAGADTGVLSVYESNNPLSKSITKMTVPTKKELNSTYGEITYEFIDSIQSATIDIYVKVDEYKYYGPHTIKNPISLSLEKSGTSLGEVDQFINASGISGADSLGFVYTTSNSGNSKIPVSTDASNLSVGKTPGAQGTSYYGTIRANAKKSKMYMHYPSVMNYKSNITDAGFTTTVDEATKTVVYEKEIWEVVHDISKSNIIYTLPLGVAPGKYTIDNADYMELTFYDGTIKTKTISSAKYSVEVVEKVENKFSSKPSLTLSNFNNSYPENNQNVYTASMSVKNNSGATITNQVFEMSVEPDFKATSVFMPKGNDEPKNIVYKTNLNSNERSYTGVVPIHTTLHRDEISSDKQREISKELLGLSANEYITYVRADIGSFEEGYSQKFAGDGTSFGNGDRISLYGHLVYGSAGAQVTYNLYDKNNPSENNVTQTTTIKKNDISKFNIATGQGYVGGTVNAGKSFETKGRLAISEAVTGYNSNSSNIVKNPKVYIVEEPKVVPQMDTLKITDRYKNSVPFTYSSRNLVGGKILHIVEPDFDYIIAINGENRSSAVGDVLDYSFMTKTSISASGIVSPDNVFWNGQDRIDFSGLDKGVQDTNDYDQDGDTTEALVRSIGSNSKMTIIKNNNVLVETGLSIEGEPSLPTYEEQADQENNNTIANFMPGMNADYKVDVLNNSDGPAKSTVVYIPIPKTGVDFGKRYQDAPFKWDMSVKSALTPQSGIEISYSTDATPDKMNDDGTTTATFSSTFPSNPSDIKMIKLASINPIPVGASAQFHIPLKIDETFDSAAEENKIDTLNVFNPYYYVDSDAYKGGLAGTKVGARLVLAEIGGTIFEDMDANGLYDASIDKLMPNQKVELYKLNETTGKYEAVMDGSNQLTATSDENGVYVFPAELGLDDSTYAIKFIEKAGSVYQYTKQNVSNAAGDELIDSDAIMFNDIPNPGDTYRGWVLDITATKAEAKTIGVGFLQYDPPADLKVSINEDPNEVRVGETITVGTVISPTFFDEIKHLDTPYTWKIVGGATEEAKATLINNNDGTVTIVPSDSVKGTTTIDIEITIMDIYGGISTSEKAIITIISDMPPTLTATDISTYVGNPVSELVSNSNLTAVDNAGNDLPVVFTAGATNNTKFTHTAPTDGTVFTETGTYEVTYSVTDKWGNVGTVTKLVKVNEGPTVTSYGSQYVLGTAEADILADVANDVNASWLKAPDAVGAAVSTTIAGPATTTGGNDTIKYELDASNPSTDFSVTGIYKVNYTATNPDGKTATTTKYILITGTEVEANEAGLMISAVGFIVEQEDKVALTEDMAKDADHSKVEAYKAIKDADGNVTSYVDLTTDATLKNKEVISSVNNAPVTGGIYTATYEITDADGTAEVTVAIIVNGTNVTIENGIAIYADSFVIENEEAATMDDAKVVTHGNIIAVRVSDSTFITNITSDTAQLDVIKAVNAGGGIFPLTVTANDTADSVSKDIKVTVKGYNVNVENGISIYAESFRIPNAEAAGLDSDLALSTSKAHAINSVTGVELTDLTVNEEELAAINAATTRGGIFKLTVYASEDDRTAAKVIYVTVEGTQVVIGDLTITAEGFSVGQADAKLLDEDMAKELSKVFAVDTATGQPVTDIKANPDDIKKINNDDGTGGVYELTFTATNEAGETVSITVYVTVEGSNVTVVNGIAIEAYGFSVPYKESLTLTATDIFERSQAKAWYVVDYTMIENININLDHLTSIHKGPKSGGVYDVEAKVETDTLSRNATAATVAAMVPVTVIGEEEVPAEVAQTGFNASALLFSMILTALLGFILILKRRNTTN